MTTTTFISLIKGGMEKSGLSLREVARIVEVDPSYLSKILAGKRTPPNDEKILKHLAEVLDLDPLRLIISTGVIPADWQAKMEEEIVINELSRFFRGGNLEPLKGYSTTKRTYHLHKPKELSEDLL